MVRSHLVCVFLTIAVFTRQAMGVKTLDRTKYVFGQGKKPGMNFQDIITFNFVPEDQYDQFLKEILVKELGDHNLKDLAVAMRVIDKERHPDAEFGNFVGSNATHTCYMEVAVMTDKRYEHERESCGKVKENKPGRDFNTLETINVIELVMVMAKRCINFLGKIEREVYAGKIK